MNTSSPRRPLLALASALLMTFSGLAVAEPPSRAARLGYIDGAVSFLPGGHPDWVRARVNRPLTTGDRLWTGGNSRAELQIGGAAIRMGPSTSMVLLNLDDRIAQVQLSQGTLKIRVRSLGPRQTFEVATPNLAFTLRRPGEYRIEVDRNDGATAVLVQNGAAEVYGGRTAYTLNTRQGYRFYGTDLSDYDTLTARREDDLDRWSRQRDRLGDRSVSARYVSYEVVGYEDLDANGTWRADPNYGNVWTPRRVAANWTPYRDGHWSWIDPWGWTWVDDAPWGYAVSHYGRWANISGSWAWVPGPKRERAVYAPALVAFVGGKNFQASATSGNVSPTAIGWFPLAPREVYQPSYPVSRVYFDNINRSNALIPAQTITNIYNTTNVTTNTTIVNTTTTVVYANQQVTGAVVAVPAQAFVQSQPVAKAMVQVPREAVVSAPVLRMASVAPVQQSVQGGAPAADTRPPVLQQAVVARTAPPSPPVAFAVQQAQLAAKPGMPIDEAQRTQLQPAAPSAQAPKVSVAAAVQPPTATALPPATAPAAKSQDERKAAAAAVPATATVTTPPTATASSGVPLKQAEDKTAAAKAEAARAESVKAEATKADAARAADAKAADARADATKAASAKAEAVKAQKAKADAAQADALKAEAMKAETARADAAKAATVKAEAANAEASKAAAAKAAAATAEAAKAATAKADEARAANAKAEAGKADEAKAQKAKADAAQAEASKADAMKAEAARADAAKAATAKAEAAKAEVAKTALAKEPAGAPAPKTRASGPKSDADGVEADEAKKGGRKP